MSARGTFEVAVLAGGEGKRLRSRAGGLPKAMVPIAGKPLLEHQVELCARHGFRRILLLVHRGHDVIQAHFGNGSRHGVTIDYQVEETSRGTAGALCDALDRLDPAFLVVYGDLYLDVDLRRFWDAHAGQGADATLMVQPSDHPSECDLLELDANGYVTALHPYPHPEARYFRNHGNAALYALQRRPLEALHLDPAARDIARHVFPAMLRSGRRLFAYLSPEYIRDAGTPERLDRVVRDIAAGVPERLSGRQLRSAVFLDRDVLLKNKIEHLTDPAELRLLDGMASAVRQLNLAGYLAIVMSRQPVVAHRELPAADLEAVHAKLEHLLSVEGAYVDRIYATGGREPGTGSIDAACEDLAIDRGSSWLAGDSMSPIETARDAGLRTAPDLGTAVSWILAVPHL